MVKKARAAHGKGSGLMDEKARTLPGEEQTDIFLCTRELPDKLTAETAALRQLCAALAGEGYRVFFPPASFAMISAKYPASSGISSRERYRVSPGMPTFTAIQTARSCSSR